MVLSILKYGETKLSVALIATMWQVLSRSMLILTPCDHGALHKDTLLYVGDRHCLLFHPRAQRAYLLTLGRRRGGYMRDVSVFTATAPISYRRDVSYANETKQESWR